MTAASHSYNVIVDQPNECTDLTNFLQCEGELSGRYRWVQENQMTNYVLFTLSRRATISAVNLTYSVDSESETPKVSFCVAPNDTSINSAFANLTCQEVLIEATNGETITRITSTPFTNITNRIVMEIITQGIKASFTASAVQFFGFYVTTGEYIIIYYIHHFTTMHITNSMRLKHA